MRDEEEGRTGQVVLSSSLIDPLRIDELTSNGSEACLIIYIPSTLQPGYGHSTIRTIITKLWGKLVSARETDPNREVNRE